MNQSGFIEDAQLSIVQRSRNLNVVMAVKHE
jgi:hypothetical protein